MIKVFGVGNILLCDDGIGVMVCENLKERFSKYKEIEFICAETDVSYCLEYIENINTDDLLIIIDSTYMGISYGSISMYSFKSCDRFIRESLDSHGETFLKVLRREYRNVKGYLIGIEVFEVDYYLGLSEQMDSMFESICDEVENKIRTIYKSIIMGDGNNA